MSTITLDERTEIAHAEGVKAWRAYSLHLSYGQALYLAEVRAKENYANYRTVCAASRDLADYLRGEGERAKAKALGYEVDDLTYYSLPVLRELVTAVLEDYHPKPDDGVRSISDPAEGGNMLAMLADAQRAIAALPPEYRAAVYLHHGGYTTDPENYSVALCKMQDYLGGNRPKAA